MDCLLLPGTTIIPVSLRNLVEKSLLTIENVAPIKDEKENPTGMVITFRDITKYKTDITNYKMMEEQSSQTVSELRHQTRLMKTVFDSMSDGIVVLSLAGHVLFINPSIHQVFGTEPLEDSTSSFSAACRSS